MSSSLGLLGYVLRKSESSKDIQTRVRHCRDYMQAVTASSLHTREVGDGRSGLVGFIPEDVGVEWDSFAIAEGRGVAWAHIPSAAGSPNSNASAASVADDLFRERVAVGELGSPFAAMEWGNGHLRIKNDQLGLVRLFHYEFPDGDIWTTRMGLAHVFMGEIPQKNRLAWAGMSTLGFAPGGATQLGNGWQLTGGSSVSAGWHGDERYVSSVSNYADWFAEARTGQPPTAGQHISDMESLVSTARRWPQSAVADLSGGKDSRVVSAVAIRTGAARTVRTIANDMGEVETAQKLVSAIDDSVKHLVVEPRDPSVPGGFFLDRLETQHAAWEGRFLASSGFDAPSFVGFKSPQRATFNGLGGEVLGGGNFTTPGELREKMIAAPLSAGQDRLVSMARRSSPGATTEAAEMVAEYVSGYISMCDDLGVKTASALLDLFYSRDRMPNWANTFAKTSVICPLFSSSLLTLAARHTGRPVADGYIHRMLLKEAIPEWTQIPFYKGKIRTRVKPYIWESPDWGSIKKFTLDNLDRSENFAPEKLRTIISGIQESSPSKREEVVLLRFLWELSFDSYLEGVANAAKATRKALQLNIVV